MVGRAGAGQDEGDQQRHGAGADGQVPPGVRVVGVAVVEVLHVVAERVGLPQEERPRGQTRQRGQEGDDDERNAQLAPELHLLFMLRPNRG